jgi:radical SAM-linked protein
VPDRDESVPREPAEPVQRWRVVVRRVANPPDAIVRDARGAWAQALVDGGLPLAGWDAGGGRPKLAIAAPLAAGVEGRRELIDLWLTARLPRWQVREALERHAPEGCTVIDLFDVWLRAPSLPGQVVASVYRCPLPVDLAPARAAEAARRLLAAERLPRERAKGDSLVAYDLRPAVENVTVEQVAGGRADLVMVLRHHPERGIGRPEELLAELSDRLGSSAIRESASGLVRERIVLADDDPGPQAAGL